jgi:N-carbamoyl-L-amino-acid hydrolase
MAIGVNSERLWNDLMQMAEIGRTPAGGCNRQALTDLDMRGRALFQSWCEVAGLVMSADAGGNLFARLEGADPSLPPLVLGSHLDTQPTGGKFDGILGVLAALEVVRQLQERGITPRRPVEIACWMNEEGARFAPAMMGSGLYAGALDLEEIRAVTDADGVSIGAELERHGFTALPQPADKDIHAYLELHIEQGPVLEAEGADIGVVTGAQGIRWYDVVLRGAETHAGPSPMEMRRDPVTLLPDLIAGVMAIGTGDPLARATVGQIGAHPGSRNVVPGRVELSVDLRHPDEAVLTQMHQTLTDLVAGLTHPDSGLSAALNQVWHSPVVAFDPGLVSAIRQGAIALGLSHRDIVSGAGHDALMVARRAPTAMIFTPCRDGISHNEAEHIEPHQAAAGAHVLLEAVLRLIEQDQPGMSLSR